MGQKLFLARDEGGFAKAAAQHFLETVALAISERGRAVVAISGGSTPQSLFKLLGDSYYRERISWPQLFLFWVDERCVPPHDPQSNYGVIKDIFLSRVPLAETHVHRMRGEMVPPHEGAKAYESELRAFFNQQYSIPKFDLILLGVGEDGHTASLFPQTEALNEKNHWVVANYVGKFSSNRLTMTFPLINNARRIIFLCAGSGKAGIVKEIFREGDSKTRYPAQMVQPTDGELTWLLDPQAAVHLKGETRYQAIHL